MALTQSELQRVKYELGFNQLSVGAEPYIGVTRYFEQVVVPNLNAGALTTSSTAVTAASSPTPVSLTLADATGFAMMNRVVVDVDENQETAQVRSVAGSVVTLLLTKAHSGTYPVTVEGGESMVRNLLRILRDLEKQLEKGVIRDGVTQVATIKLGSHKGDGDQLDRILERQKKWRTELCMLLFGCGNIGSFGGGGARIGVY